MPRTRQAAKQAEKSDKNTSKNSKKRKRDAPEDMGGCLNSKPQEEATTSKESGPKQQQVEPAKKKAKKVKNKPCPNCHTLEENAHQLEHELDKSKHEAREYTSRYEESVDLEKEVRIELELQKTKNKQLVEERASATKASDQRYDAVCGKFEGLHDKLRRAEEKLNHRNNELKAASDTIKKYEDKVAALNEDLNKRKADNDRLLNRVSELAGAKLSAGNPNLVDISDENRPTKLAERYTELYDNDWTDAFAVLTDAGNDDQQAIDTLHKVLINIYSECKDFAGEDLKYFNDNVMKSFRYEENSAEVMVLTKQYTDRRKKIYRTMKAGIKPEIKTRLKQLLSKKDRKALQKFTDETFDICLLMCVQDPQVYIENVTENPGSFDSTKYKAYTRSGKTVEFVVWPPLYLHKDGPMLAKGIAQGKKDFSKTMPVPLASSNEPIVSKSSIHFGESSGKHTEGKVRPKSSVITVGGLKRKQQQGSGNTIVRPNSDIVKASGANSSTDSTAKSATVRPDMQQLLTEAQPGFNDKGQSVHSGAKSIKKQAPLSKDYLTSTRV